MGMHEHALYILPATDDSLAGTGMGVTCRCGQR